MRLGYIAVHRPAVERAGRFNEAEAHAPRIHGPGLQIPGIVGSFNEAEAHAPRIPSSLTKRS